MSIQGRDRPRIVVLADHYLPGWRAGGPIRSLANMVAALGDEFDFRVVTRDRDHLGFDGYGEEIQPGWNRVGEAHVLYCSPDAMSRRVLGSILREASPDLVFANSLFSPFTRYALALHRSGALSAPLLIAPRGELGEGALAQKRFRKALYVTWLQKLGQLEGVTWQASNQREAAAMAARLGVEPLIASDIPEPPLVEPVAPIDKRPGRVRLVFTARISPMKNLPFLLDLLPALDTEIHLDVYGPAEESEMAIVSKAMGAMPDHVTVRYRGAVSPAEVAAVLVESHFSVLPTLDENFAHSIYEALRVGRPVIVSDRTPWTGLESDQAGWDLPLDQERWKGVLRKIGAMDQGEYGLWVAGAHRHAVEWYVSTRPAHQQAKVFRRLLAGEVR